eukprot:462040_1
METLQQNYSNVSNKLSTFIALPPFGFATVLIGWNIYTITQMWRREATNPTSYSKFTISDKINNKYKVSGAMLQTTAYGIPFIAIASYVFYKFKQQKEYKTLLTFLGFFASKIRVKDNSQFRLMLPTIMMLLHFMKRIFEANFIHIISNKGHIIGAIFIGLIGYTLGCLIPLYYQLNYLNKSFYKKSKNTFIIGIILYFLGEFGNLYHHYLLRQLRLNNNKSSKKEKYFLPKGGLFKYIWCPHYLFELMAWFGIATTSKHLLFFMTALNMSSYLSGRSLATKEWYEKRFVGQTRNAILPFVL